MQPGQRFRTRTTRTATSCHAVGSRLFGASLTRGWSGARGFPASTHPAAVCGHPHCFLADLVRYRGASIRPSGAYPPGWQYGSRVELPGEISFPLTTELARDFLSGLTVPRTAELLCVQAFWFVTQVWNILASAGQLGACRTSRCSARTSDVTLASPDRCSIWLGTDPCRHAQLRQPSSQAHDFAWVSVFGVMFADCTYACARWLVTDGDTSMSQITRRARRALIGRAVRSAPGIAASPPASLGVVCNSRLGNAHVMAEGGMAAAIGNVDERATACSLRNTMLEGSTSTLALAAAREGAPGL